jgi:hypothetical protein
MIKKENIICERMKNKEKSIKREGKKKTKKK